MPSPVHDEWLTKALGVTVNRERPAEAKAGGPADGAAAVPGGDGPGGGGLGNAVATASAAVSAVADVAIRLFDAVAPGSAKPDAAKPDVAKADAAKPAAKAADPLAPLLADIDTALGKAKAEIDAIAEPALRDPLNAQLEKFRQQRAAAAGAAAGPATIVTLVKLNTDIAALIVGDIAKAKAQAASITDQKTSIGKTLEYTQSWIDSCDKRARPVLNTLLEQLNRKKTEVFAEKDSAKLVAGLGKLESDANQLYSKAVDTSKESEKLAAAKFRVDQVLDAIAKFVATMPKGGPKTALTADLVRLGKEATEVFAGEDWAKLLTDAEKLRAEAETALTAARVETVDADKKKAEIEKTLAEIKTTIDGIKDAKQSEPLKKELAELDKQKAALALRAGKALKEGLVALDPATLKLLQKAKTAALKEMAAQPDGAKKIDDMVGALGDKTKDPQSEAVCKAAIEARYGINFSETDLGTTKKLPALYKLLGKVPASHVVNNPNLKALTYNTEDRGKGNYYSGDHAKIALNDVDEDGNKIDNNYFGPDGKSLSPVYFDVTTLHEIGHAVDKKQSFMDTNGKDAKYGQWKPETIDTVAAAHAESLVKAFTGGDKKAKEADLIALLKRCLSTGAVGTKPKDAAAELGSLRDDWDKIIAAKAVAACQVIGVKSEPWMKGDALAKKVVVGERVYHEAYENNWVSYALGDRPGTVALYQWRAPAEWFAEIYAMYYMKTLKPSHFMTKWFEEQAPPTK